MKKVDLHLSRKTIAADKSNNSVEGIFNVGHCLGSIKIYERLVANSHKFDDLAVLQKLAGNRVEIGLKISLNVFFIIRQN